jgi:1,4-dihydroxy-2-naphthoate octaprenyltransferase
VGEFSFWIKAARLRTLPLALSCTFMGSALAFKFNAFDLTIFIFAIITTVVLQVLSNFANDYGDFKNGADTVKNRADRMLSSGNISEKDMQIALVLTSIVALVSGCILLFISFDKNELAKLLLMLFLGLAAIWAALKYTTGENPYGYKGLGDLFVFLFFGLVGVMGTSYLYYQNFTGLHVLASMLVGFMSVAVLNLNNLRDINTDELAIKITIPVRLGWKKAKIYHTVLMFSAWICLVILLINYWNLYLSIILLPFAIQVKHLLDVWKCTVPEALDAELKKVALTTFLITFFFFLIVI